MLCVVLEGIHWNFFPLNIVLNRTVNGATKNKAHMGAVWTNNQCDKKKVRTAIDEAQMILARGLFGLVTGSVIIKNVYLNI